MRLTELAIKKIQPAEKAIKKFDGGGLYLLVKPTGRYWRYKYRFHGREKCLSLGAYPVMNLKMAREAHREAKCLLDKGTCPATEKQRIKREQMTAHNNTFELVAREWYELKRPEWKNPKHAQQVINTLSSYVFPAIGDLPVSDIAPMTVFDVLKKISDKAETCSRVKQRITAVFDYAIQTGRATWNPAQSLPNLGKGKQVQHHPALPAKDIPAFFKKLSTYNNPQSQLAMRFLMLTFVRVGELLQADWSQIEDNEWHIPAEKMKMKRPHVVPLSNWALETLEEIRALNPNSPLLFPSPHRGNKSISNNTLSLAMKRMGYTGIATPHGFRSLASSVLNESGRFNADAIERQLAHQEKNAVRAAYNRAEYLAERHTMMNWWSDYLHKRYREAIA